MIEMKFPDMAGKLERAKPEVELFLAANMQTNRGQVFDKEGANNGHSKWGAPLLRAGQTGKARGVLSKSIGPGDGKPGPGGVVRMSDGVIEVGTAVAYGPMFNWGTKGLPGGVLRPKNGKFLRIPLPAGKRATDLAKELRKGAKADDEGQKFIFAKQVKIEPRPFDQVNETDAREFADAQASKMAEVLNR